MWSKRMRTAVGVVSVLALLMTGACGGADGAPTGTGAAGLDRTGGGVEEEPVVLTMASMEDNLNRDPQVQHFVDQVAAASGGALIVEVVSRCCGYDAEAEVALVEKVAAGETHLGWVGTRVFDTMGVTSFQPLTAPFMLDSYAVQEAVMASDVPERMLADLDGLGVVGLAVLAGGLRRPMASEAPLLGPDDWDGITFHAWWSDLSRESIAALGAAPSGPDRDAGLADGTIRGFENTMTFHALTTGVPQQTPYVTSNVALWPKTVAIVANPGALASLTDQQVAWLGDAAGRAALDSAQVVDVDDELVAIACDIGSRFGEASEADLAGLRGAVAPVYDRMRQDPALAESIADIEDLKRSTPADVLEIPDGCTGVSPFAEPSSGSSEPLPIDGTWVASFTRDELLAAGLMDAGEDNDGSWGDMVFRLDRGALDWDVTNARLRATYSGTYEVDGAAMRFTLDGEDLACGWSIFRDTLTLTRDRSLGICPTSLIVEPWVLETPAPVDTVEP